MEIEYKRELTKSYMCVKTDQDFLPFEKEITCGKIPQDQKQEKDELGLLPAIKRHNPKPNHHR